MGGDQGDREIREGFRLDDSLTERVIGALIEVHRHLGPGVLESAYEECLCHELSLRGIAFRRQVSIPVEYKGVRLDCGYRADLVVDGRVLVELKTVDALHPIHRAQVSTYLKLAGVEIGLVVNFNVMSIRRGLRRVERKNTASPSLISRSLDLPPKGGAPSSDHRTNKR